MKFWVDAQLPPTSAGWLCAQYGVDAASLREAMTLFASGQTIVEVG